MVIYADVLFMVNFIMDALCLYVTGKVINAAVGKVRLMIASAMGGAYCVAGQFIIFPEPITGIIVSALMVYVCFKHRSILSYIKALILMYSVGMLFGGIMTFLQQTVYRNRELLLFNNGAGVVEFAVIFVSMLLFVLASSKMFSVYINKKSATCIISNGVSDKKIKLLIDSGNMLTDPYSGKPVVIIKAEILDELLGKDGIHRNFCPDEKNAVVEGKLHFISAKTVGGNVLLPVLGCIKIFACGKKQKKELYAAVASDSSSNDGYMGNDGVMPYMLEGSY